jgi:uncharacterized protein YegP (UPF0339 family)
MKLEVYLDSADEWRWRVKADNNETIADSSEGYTERNDAIEAYERLEDAILAGVGDKES